MRFTLSHETKRNIMVDCANYSTEKLREKVTKGIDGKLNGDNLDIYVTTNEMRLDNKNKDCTSLLVIIHLTESTQMN